MKILKLMELVVRHTDRLHPNHLSRDCFPHRKIHRSYGSTATEEVKILKLMELVVGHMDRIHPNHLSRECFPRGEIHRSHGSPDTEEMTIFKLMELVVWHILAPPHPPLPRRLSPRRNT